MGAMNLPRTSGALGAALRCCAGRGQYAPPLLPPPARPYCRPRRRAPSAAGCGSRPRRARSPPGCGSSSSRRPTCSGHRRAGSRSCWRSSGRGAGPRAGRHCRRRQPPWLLRRARCGLGEGRGASARWRPCRGRRRRGAPHGWAMLLGGRRPPQALPLSPTPHPRLPPGMQRGVTLTLHLFLPSQATPSAAPLWLSPARRCTVGDCVLRAALQKSQARASCRQAPARRGGPKMRVRCRQPCCRPVRAQRTEAGLIPHLALQQVQTGDAVHCRAAQEAQTTTTRVILGCWRLAGPAFGLHAAGCRAGRCDAPHGGGRFRARTVGD